MGPLGIFLVEHAIRHRKTVLSLLTGTACGCVKYMVQIPCDLITFATHLPMDVTKR